MAPGKDRNLGTWYDQNGYLHGNQEDYEDEPALWCSAQVVRYKEKEEREE